MSDAHAQKGQLDEPARHDELAYRSGYSRAQFYRNIRRSGGPTPIAQQKRLLLERAAYELTHTELSVTEIAFRAGFESLEGFLRRFRARFGVAPRRYRTMSPSDFWLDAFERVHFAPTQCAVAPLQGVITMKLIERLIRHHEWSMTAILDRCSAMPEGTLDQVIATPSPLPWDCEPVTYRGLIHRCVGFAEPWLSAWDAAKPEYDRTSFDGMKSGVKQNADRLMEFAERIEADGRWDLTFVDKDCDPPEVFSYIGVIGHLTTFNAYRRVLLIAELKAIGIEGLGFGDPIEFDEGRRAELEH